MAIFDANRPKVIDASGGGGVLLRWTGFGIIAFVLVILLFSSVTSGAKSPALLGRG